MDSSASEADSAANLHQLVGEQGREYLRNVFYHTENAASDIMRMQSELSLGVARCEPVYSLFDELHVRRSEVTQALFQKLVQMLKQSILPLDSEGQIRMLDETCEQLQDSTLSEIPLFLIKELALKGCFIFSQKFLKVIAATNALSVRLSTS